MPGGGVFRPGGEPALEESDGALRHPDRERREFLRRILDVRLAVRANRRNGEDPGRHGREPIGGGSEVALDQVVQRTARHSGVRHRVALPVAQDVERQELGPDRALESGGVDPVVKRERRAVEGHEPVELDLEVCDPALDPRARAIRHLRVVLVKSRRRAFSGGEIEAGVEVVIDELREARGGRRRGRCRRDNGHRVERQPENEQEQRNSSFHGSKS